MKTIKFRAWDDDKEKMFNPLHHDIYDFDEIVARGYPIMQFTGLKDKNGKEIYEGDLWIWGGAAYEICYDDYTEGFTSRSKNYHWLKRDDGYTYYNYSLINIEVIGNIYENPELI